MAIDIQQFLTIDVPVKQDDSEASLGSIENLAEVRAVAEALDRLRKMCDRVGPMTLLAQVNGVPSELICAALNEITLTGETVLDNCLKV